MKYLIYLILLGLTLSSCSLNTTKIVSSVNEIYPNICIYRYMELRYLEGADRVESIGDLRDSCGKYNIGDTIN